MTTWSVAVVREYGRNWAVVLVKDFVVSSPTTRANTLAGWKQRLGCPVALLGENNGRTWGDLNVVQRMRNVHPSQLPWQRMAT